MASRNTRLLLWIWVVPWFRCVWMHFEHFSTIIHSFYLMLPLIMPTRAAVPLLSVCILMHFDCWCALRIFGTWKCIDEKLSHFTIFRLNTSWHEKRGNTAQTCWNRSELSELINAPNEWIKWQNASGAGCWPGNWVCASAAQYLNVTTAVRRRLYCFTWKIYFLKYSSGKWVITATQSIVSAHAVNYFPT